MAEGGEVPLSEQSSYVAPTKECDLVMKGGITSGVIYPLAVCRLATAFRLRQIGGTSAGAIAAAVAAAAEHGRDAGGFVKLAAMPAWLAGPAAPPARGSNLRRLFQPAKVTRKPFSIAMALVESGSKPAKAARLAWRMVFAHPVAGLGGALPGLQLAALAFRLGGAAVAPAVIAGLVLAIIGGAGALAVAAVVHAGRALPENGFGLCPGLPGLTEWLAAQLDDVAGIDQGRPLTFGDSEGQRHTAADADDLPHARNALSPSVRAADIPLQQHPVSEALPGLRRRPPRPPCHAAERPGQYPCRGAPHAPSRHGPAPRCRRRANEPELPRPPQRHPHVGGGLRRHGTGG